MNTNRIFVRARKMIVENEKQFRISVCSDRDFELLVIDINYKRGRIATLSCDEGINHTKVDIRGRYKDAKILTFEYQKLIDLLKSGFNELMDLKKEKHIIAYENKNVITLNFVSDVNLVIIEFMNLSSNLPEWSLNYDAFIKALEDGFEGLKEVNNM